jgi:tetratricopeptide (TPR) repeat protein
MGLGVDPVSLAGTEVDRLVEEAADWRYRDADRSAALLDRAESAMDGRRDLGRAAQIGEIRGDLALANGHLGDAATAFRLARRNWLAVGRRLEAVRAALRGATVQNLLGEFEQAEAAVHRVQAQLGREAHEDSRMGRLEAAVQLLLADATAGRGDLATAIRHYDTAENLFVALGDAGGVTLVNVRRGLATLDAGLAHNALQELNRGWSANVSAGLDRVGSMVALLTAEALAATGQVSRALEVLDCVEPDMRGNRWLLGVHRLVRSMALLRAGLPAEAHADGRAAEEMFTKIGAVEYSARAELSCARASLRLERTNAAATELAVAERLFTECGSHLMRARTWLGQARLALSVDDLDAARARCRRVLDADLDDTAPYLGVHARLTLARVEEPERASGLLATAAELAARAGVPELRVDVLVARARHERRLGDSDAAIDLLRSALGVGQAWQHQLGERAGAVLPALTEATEELIALLLERNDHASLVEAWRRARDVKCQSLVPLGTRNAAPATGELRLQRLDELLGDVARSVPVEDGDPDERLPAVPWQSLVEYCISGDDVVAFVIRDGQVDARVLRDTVGETRRMVRAWQQECRLMAPGLRFDSGYDASPALDGLYEMLLAPVADLLADLDDELTVVADRHLDAVPFDALLDEVGPWFARLGLIAPARAGTTSAENGSDPRVAALVLAVPDDNAPLITAEAEMIFRTLPSAEIVVGAEATVDALVRRARQADVVHLACHGAFRPESPLSSALRLGDGWLHARDIVTGALGLEGSVVVLSACGSGLSPDYVSEPIGLASACLAAGASGVIAALWTVDDAVTLELMTYFYAALAEGLDARSALHEARRQVARQHPHPYYWAAFRYVSAPEGR